MTRFYLTGRVVVEGEVSSVDQSDLLGRQGRLALVRLVLGRHHPVPTSALAEAIWGRDAPASAEVSLRALLSKLRGVLTSVDEDTTIDADAGTYQLRSPGAWVDVEAATNAIDRAEGAWRTRDHVAAWSEAAVASAIARRPLLPGEDLDWVAEAQGRLRRIRVRALAVLVEVYTHRGDHELAVATARDLVALEPFRESSHRLLMRAHTEAGNRAEALRAFDDCRILLRDELGVDPSPETTAAHRAILG